MRMIPIAAGTMLALLTGSAALALGGGGPAAMMHNNDKLRDAPPRAGAGDQRSPQVPRTTKARRARTVR